MSQKYKQWDCQKWCGVVAVWLLLAFGVAIFERAQAQSFGEIWIWDEAPIVRTVSSGGNLTIDLRNLGHGEEGSTYQSFTFTVITTQADSLPGFADTKPSWIAHSAGVLTVSNAVAGTYSFTMRARKSTPPLSPLSSGKVGVRVIVNSPPVAVNDAYSQTHATTVDRNVLANDTDANGDALTLATEDSSYSTIVGNQLRFAAPAVSGTYVVTYTVSDGKGGTGTATATFTVPNVAPNTTSDSYTQAHSTTVNHNVLANDTDANGDALTLTSENSPYASIVGNQLQFAAPAASGVYVVTYTISDGKGGTGSATATFNVPNVSPVPVNDTYTQAHSTTVDHNVLTNDSDPNVDTLTLATEDSAYSSIVGNQLRFAAPAASGTYVVTYTVSDGKGGTGTATATFTVPAFNVSPVAVNDTATASSGVPKIIQVLANDTDSDGTVTQALIAAAPAQGTASVNPGGTVTYTSTAGYAGPDSFTYRAIDNQGAQSQVASVSITVEPAPPSILGYAYDALGRLSMSTVSTGPGGATQTWSGYCYDASGNRTIVTSGTGTPGGPCN